MLSACDRIVEVWLSFQFDLWYQETGVYFIGKVSSHRKDVCVLISRLIPITLIFPVGLVIEECFAIS